MIFNKNCRQRPPEPTEGERKAKTAKERFNTALDELEKLLHEQPVRTVDKEDGRSGGSR